MHSKPILIVGSGAMACLFAARLAASGERVFMLGHWREGLEAVRRDGVCVETAEGQAHCYPVTVFERPEDVPTVKYALVLVKAWATRQAAAEVQTCLDDFGLALTLQNGLGNHEILAKTLGTLRTALGVTTAGAFLTGPGRVQPGGEGGIIIEMNPRIEPLASALTRAGFSVETSARPEEILWGKLVINAAINPLTALLGVTNGELLERAPALELMKAAALEAAAVAAVCDTRLPYADPVEAVLEVARRTARNRSSMLQDVLRGAHTEIDAICGAITRAGHAVGVPTPVNEVLWKLVCSL